MKRLVLVIVLCGCATGCKDKDTGTAGEWPRSIEPRLTTATEWRPCRSTLQPGHAVEEAVCGPAPPPSASPRQTESCDELVPTPAQALRILTMQPSCIDTAIAGLERFARADAGAASDLAAAYYLRAQREDRPSDLMSALEEAEHALAIDPRLPAARFNLALAQEALGLKRESIASWKEFRTSGPSPWSGEALAHRNRLAGELAGDAAAQWSIAKARLPAALSGGDPAGVARLILPFPAAAERYLEEELLAQWAAAPSRERLELAARLAAALRQRTGDPYPVAIVAAIEHAAPFPAQLAALRKGHLAFSAGRAADQAFERQAATAAYEQALPALTAGGSPLALPIRLKLAVNRSFAKGASAGPLRAWLDPIGREADEKGYVDLQATVRATRAYLLFGQDRYLESLAEYGKALATFVRIGDGENIAATRSRMNGVLRTMGQKEVAFREDLPLIRHPLPIADLRQQHNVLGETALTALALGHPRVALLYQNTALRLIRGELVAVPPEQKERIRNVQQNLAIVLRERAGIELHLEQLDRARDDLDEATRLANRPHDAEADNKRVLQARMDELRGQALLHVAPPEAVAAYTRALAQTDAADRRTFRASLLAQRGEANRRAGNSAAAEADLGDALRELEAEELLILQHRRLGEGEDLWSSYFERFQETYQLLIRQLVEETRPDEAFAYAEEAKAFEPLQLISRSPLTPRSFRALARNGQPAALKTIQASLLPGTYLIEYRVLQDRTYAWVVSHQDLRLLTLPVSRDNIERWSGSLQRLARQRNEQAFGAGLFAPYAGLIAPPLAAIAKMARGSEPLRLVFVPDGAIHGLPFAALRSPDTRRYLVEDATVSIAGSATLYLFSLQRDRALSAGGPPSALLFGDPAFNPHLPEAQGLARLPGAALEVRRIQQLYAPHAEVREGTAATVPELLRLARSSTVVHIAAHALADARAPAHSLLLLAPSPHHTGALRADELLTRVQLNETHLVVLSACSSAGGLPVGAEGVAPLVRPLIAAGVPAVVGSLWDVEDATTEELLVSFHRHYRQGSDAAVALQSAQLDLLRNINPGLRPALVWAPFQVIGHAASPFAPTPHH